MIREIPYKNQKDIDGSIIPREAVFQMYTRLLGKVVRYEGVLYFVVKVTLSSNKDIIKLHLSLPKANLNA